MEQAPTPKKCLDYGTPEQRKDYVHSLYTFGVDAILESLQDFLEQNTKSQSANNTENNAENQTEVCLPQILTTTFEQAVKFTAILEAILGLYGNMQGSGSLDYKANQPGVFLPNLGWSTHLFHRTLRQSGSVPDPRSPEFGAESKQTQREASWIRGAFVLREVQRYLSSRNYTEHVARTVAIGSKDMISALQYCIWTFVGQGKIVMAEVDGQGLVMPSDIISYLPDLPRLLRRWESGETLEDLMKSKDFTPIPNLVHKRIGNESTFLKP